MHRVIFFDSANSFTALRLHPPIPDNSRVASIDTVLPTGGGSNGLSPVFVAAGTEVAIDSNALHRRKDLWGNDADEFRPERWTSEKTSWVSRLSFSLSKEAVAFLQRFLSHAYPYIEVSSLQRWTQGLYRP